MSVYSFLTSATVEELIQHIVDKSFLSNKRICNYFLIDNWDKIPKGSPYPILTAQVTGYEFDVINTYADIRIIILYKRPTKIICPEDNDLCLDMFLSKLFQFYARSIFEIQDYLLGNTKLPDGNIISDFSLAGKTFIRQWKSYEDYNRVILRGRGEENLLPEDVSLVEATMPLKGSRDRLCCNVLNPDIFGDYI